MCKHKGGNKGVRDSVYNGGEQEAVGWGAGALDYRTSGTKFHVFIGPGGRDTLCKWRDQRIQHGQVSARSQKSPCVTTARRLASVMANGGKMPNGQQLLSSRTLELYCEACAVCSVVH